MSSIKFGNPLGGFHDYRNSSVSVTPATGPKGFTAYLYQCWLNVDWDGAHKAYGLDRRDADGRTFPLQKGLSPLESGSRGSLRNARRKEEPHDWVGLVAMNRSDAIAVLRDNYPGWAALGDPKHPGVLTAAQQTVLSQFWDNRTVSGFGSLEDVAGNGKFPIVQLKQLNQPQPGYYVSQSPAFDRTPPIHLWDQNIYLDASEVPFSVVPRLHGVRLGDFGLVICNSTGQATPFLYGDASGSTAGSLALGECSGYIFETIGNGNNDQTFSFIAFPGTGSGVADQNAVAKLKSTVRALMGKISDDDDSISARLANDEWQYRDLSLAVYNWGGPYFMGHRAHGGPETRAEDFPDGQ